MKKTKKSLVLSIVTLLLCSCMFVGSTFAWFTDTVSNTGNRIQAGTLKVDLLMDKMQGHTANSYVSIANGTGDIFATDETKASQYKDSHLNGILWEPGKTEIAYLAVENKGNLALKYKLVLDVQDLRTHEGKANTDMAKAFNFVIVDGAHEPLTAIASWQDAVTKSGMAPINLWDAIQQAAPGQHSGRIDPAGQGVLDGINQNPKVENERDYFAIVVHMDENAGNDYQAGTILFDLNLVATQLNSELDGFDSPDYDKTATFPSIATRIEGKGSTDPLEVNENTKKVSDETKEIIISSTSSTSSMTMLGNAKVPSDAVNEKPQEKNKSVIEEFLDQVNPVEGATTTKDEIILNLNVDTKEATTTKIVLDVTMDGVITRTTDKDLPTEKVQTASMVVSELADAVTVELQLDPDLEDVRMTHSHKGVSTPMDPVKNLSDLINGTFFYNSTTGDLSFKTSKFSDFLVEYTRKAVAVNTDTGKQYDTLADAFKEVGCVSTNIVIQKDTDVKSVLDKAGTTVNLDLNGHAVSNVEAKNGAINVKGNGIIYASATGEGIIIISEGYHEDAQFAGNGLVQITDGTFEQLSVAPGSDITVEITGGLFHFDPSSYLSKPYYAEESVDKDGWYAVTCCSSHVWDKENPEVIHGLCCYDGDELIYTCKNCGAKSEHIHVDHDIIGVYCNTCHAPAAYVTKITEKSISDLIQLIEYYQLQGVLTNYDVIAGFTTPRLCDGKYPVINPDGTVNSFTSWSPKEEYLIKSDFAYLYMPMTPERFFNSNTCDIGFDYKYEKVSTDAGYEYKLAADGMGEYNEYNMIEDFLNHKAVFTTEFSKDVKYDDLYLCGVRGDMPTLTLAGNLTANHTANVEEYLFDYSYSSLVNEAKLFVCGIKNKNITSGTDMTVRLYMIDRYSTDPKDAILRSQVTHTIQ